MDKISSLITKKNNLLLKLKVIDGGDGSGNFGHAGRPGKVGGSTSNAISKIDLDQTKLFMKDFNISNKQLMSDYSLYPKELMERVNKQIEKGFSIFKSNEDFERAKSRLTDNSLDDKERTKLQKAVNRQNLINDIIEKLSSNTSAEIKKDVKEEKVEKELKETQTKKEEPIKKDEMKSYKLTINDITSTFTENPEQKSKNEKYVDELLNLHTRKKPYYDPNPMSYFEKYFGKDNFRDNKNFRGAAYTFWAAKSPLAGLNELGKDLDSYGKYIKPFKKFILDFTDAWNSDEFVQYCKEKNPGVKITPQRKNQVFAVFCGWLGNRNPEKEYNDSKDHTKYYQRVLSARMVEFMHKKDIEEQKLQELNKSKEDKMMGAGKVKILNKRTVNSLNLPEIQNIKINTQAELEKPKNSTDFETSRKNLKNLLPNSKDKILNTLYSESERGGKGFDSAYLRTYFETDTHAFKKTSSLEDIHKLLCGMTMGGNIYNGTKTENNFYETGIHNLLNMVVGNSTLNDKKLVRYEDKKDRYRDYDNLQVGDTIEMDSQHFTTSDKFADGKGKEWFGGRYPVRFEIETGNAPFFNLEPFVWKNKEGVKPVKEDEGLVAGPMKIKSIEDKNGEKVIKIEYDWDRHQNYINLNAKSWAKVQKMYPEKN